MLLSIFILCFIVSHGTANTNESEISKVYITKNEMQSLIGQVYTLKKELDQCNARFHEENTVTIQDDSSIFDIRFDTLPKKCKTDTLPRNCAEATACTQRNGIYRISLQKHNVEPFLVECDTKTEGGGWTLIQRRQDGSEDFYRGWNDYQRGFGNIQGEFFIGLDNLYALTNYDGPQELLVLMDDKNEVRKAFYNNFVLGPEHESYPLQHVGVFSGTAGDSLTHHMGAKFTTKDRNNDQYSGNCAELYTGAWWYKECHISNLNGKYGDTNYAKGVTWQTFRGYNVSVEHVTMMLRRRRF